jgi:streptogramin lyase
VPGGFPSDIVTGPDGSLWFTGAGKAGIGRITTSGVITTFPVPASGITAGPDGNLWATEFKGGKIAQITTAGVVTEFSIPTANAGPTNITAGPDGSLWFAEQQGNSIGRITTTGVVTEFALPTANSIPDDITTGPYGYLYFTEDSGRIGRISTGGVITEFDASGTAPRGIAAGPDFNLWFADAGGKIGRITPVGAITTFPILTTNGFPVDIAPGPDGNLWFVEYWGNQVGRITTAGVVTEFPIPSRTSLPQGITAGPDGNLWFTEYDTSCAISANIGRITPGGVITEFPISGSIPPACINATYADDIAAGPDGNLWFTLGSGNVGRITTSGVVSLFAVPTANSFPNAIAAGSDGNLWFTEQNASEIGRITTAGVITEFPLPSANSFLGDITSAPDGNLWFTEPAGKIGRITTAGAITEFSVTPSSSPNHIASGPDGNLWYTEKQGDIGRITTAGVVTDFPVLTANSFPGDIAAGPDGSLWFTEEQGNSIGQITTTGTVSEFAVPTPDSLPSDVTSGPDGNLWFTEQRGNNIGRITSGAVASNTSTTLTSAPNPSVVGQAVTFTATATSTTGQAPPTGSVSLMEGTNTLASGTLDSSGMAQFTVSTLAAGANSLTASYAGSGSATASTSAPITQIVGVGPTTIAIASSINPSVGGQNVTYTAMVTATAPATGTGTGTVNFQDGGVGIAGCTAQPVAAAGTATCVVSYAVPGSHTISAIYSGDANFNPSTSPNLTQIVNMANTSTALASSANPSVVGQNVTFTAIVTSTTGVGTPAGAVSLLEGSTTLATGTLNSSGIAQFTISTLAAGSHSLTASYGGQGAATASASGPLTQVVKSATSVAIASSVDPSVGGQSVILTATVTPTSPSSSTPSGFVTFKDGTTPMGSGALDSTGKATFSTSGLAIGSHPITANYLGDSTFAGSTSAALTQTVNTSLKLAVTSAPVTLTAGTSSGLITVQLQNASSTPVSASSSGLNLVLKAASPTGGFRDAGDTTTISTAVIAGGSSSVQFRYRDTFAGTASITVSTQTAADATAATQSETVIPASLDHLGLRPATTTVAPGGSKTYSAEGFDVYGNDIGDVTSAAQFSVSPDGSCTGATCTIPTKGTHTVTGTDGTATGTATLVGDPGPVPTLTVTNGSGMASHTVTLNIGGTDPDGDPLTYTINYGDGTTASGSLPSGPLTHTYTSACPQCTVILSVSDGITQPIPYAVASVDIAPNQPLVVNAGDPPTITLGQAAHLDGSNSSPAPPGIDSYTWNFGDGTSATGPVQDHVYPGPAPKTWTATLTVTGGGSSASATVNVNVLPAPTTSGLTINVTGDGTPLAGATVVVENANNNIFNAVAKGGGVYTINGLPDGSYTVFGYKSGFVPNTASATISGGTGRTTLALTSGAVATTSLTATRLTAAQAAALGIDTTAPGNQNVYQFELHLSFGSGGLIAVSGAASANGFYAISGAGGIGPGGTACSQFCTTIVASVGGYSVIGNVAEIAGDNPSIIWMIVPGKAQWLKELFDVRILITNLAPPPFALRTGSATLNLPTGLSLADLSPGLPPQQLTKSIADIPGQSSQGANWLIRGDAEGFYNLSADYRAVLDPVGASVQLHAQTLNPIHIWGASALRMTFNADDVAYAGYPYHVRVSLTNVSDVPVFNPVVELMPRENDPSRNYIFQPREQYDQGTDKILPGGTFETRDFIVAPNFTGTLDLSRSFVAPVGGVAAALSAVITNHHAPLPQSYPTDTALIQSNGVAIAWNPVPGAQGYQVFGTTDYSQDFPSSFVVQIAGNRTSALLPSGSYGLIGLSTLLVGSDGRLHNVLSHPLARPKGQNPGPPQSVRVKVSNGSATVSWKAPLNSGSNLVDSYLVTATPLANDRVPAPNVSTITATVPAAMTTYVLGGLVADCHQTYEFSVTAHNAIGSSVPGVAPGGPYRPSGNIQQGVDPPLVVVLIDGKDPAAFSLTTMMGSKSAYNPLRPTTSGTSSYCPEAPWSGAGLPNPTPWVAGPRTFLNDWNFVLPPENFSNGQLTHSYMLDPLAAVGAVILPYGYPTGPATLKRLPNGHPSFKFPGYTVDGNSDPQVEAATLSGEVASINSVWPSSKIIIVGHSHGGLVAYLFWGDSGFGPGFKSHGVTRVISLDSPINGTADAALLCTVQPFCSATYSEYATLWNSIKSVDQNAIQADGDQTYVPIGTEGDSAYDRTDPGVDGILSQMLFNCASNLTKTSCSPAYPPDVQSVNCTITSRTTADVLADSHFAVRICPDYIATIARDAGVPAP